MMFINSLGNTITETVLYGMFSNPLFAKLT